MNLAKQKPLQQNARRAFIIVDKRNPFNPTS